MRIARHTVPGLVHHVISRFVDRTWMFHEACERAKYLFLLGRALLLSDWRCIAYGLMSNHIHLALVAGLGPPEPWLKRAHSPFAAWMNSRHGRLGPMFAERPTMWAIRPSDEAGLIAYIHNNPVRAHVVSRAEESDWTSYRAYVGKAKAPPWLDIGDGLLRCGFQGDPAGFSGWSTPNDAEVIEDSRLLPGVHKEARRRGAVELGTPIAGSANEVTLLARPFGFIRPDPRVILGCVAHVSAISVSDMRTVRRATAARRIAFHAAIRLGVSLSDVARTLGVTRQSGSSHITTPLTVDQRRLLELVCDLVRSAHGGAQLDNLDTVPKP